MSWDLCRWMVIPVTILMHDAIRFKIPPDPNIGSNQSIDSDTQLNLSDGGTIDFNFDVGASDGTNIEVNISGGSVGDGIWAHDGSEINISGGSVGNDFHTYSGSTVNISGGSVGDRFVANNSSTVNISGGSVGDFFWAESDSTVNISGGSVGFGFDTYSGSVANISGGSVGDDFHTFSGSVANISGGSVGNVFHVNIGSEVNISGVEFVLDGIDLSASLILNAPFPIADRDVTLIGLLADGSPFSFDLNSTDSSFLDFFSLDALLTVTLVRPGDFNGDGFVSGSDFLKWQRGEVSNPPSAEDLAVWQSHFGTISSSSLSTSVPEPATFLLALLGLSAVGMIRRRRGMA